MNNKMGKLKMNITGSFHGIWSNLFMKRKIKELGLTIDKIKHRNIHHTEIVLSGDKKQLWKALNTAKTPYYLLKMDRIVFEFTN